MVLKPVVLLDHLAAAVPTGQAKAQVQAKSTNVRRAEPMLRKDAFSPPKTLGPPKIIRFLHPGYADQSLLNLCADDQGGIAYDIAFVACCVVTGNTFQDGWLAERAATNTEDGVLRRIGPPEVTVLRGGEYFFFVGEDRNYKYPVVPSFDHWRFPHGLLPFPWNDLTIPAFRGHKKGRDAVVDRDQTCRITGCNDATEIAHLVPTADGTWFLSNKMKRYCRANLSKNPLDDDRNLIILRRDVHQLFDRRCLAIVPQNFDSSEHSAGGAPHSSRPELAIHVLQPSDQPDTTDSNQLFDLYHNRVLQPDLMGIAPELLFARFAWAIFDFRTLTLFEAKKYRVLLYNQETDEQEEHYLARADILARCRIFETYAHSRSASPRKRQRPGVGEEVAARDDNDMEEGGIWDVPRGRTVVRRGHNHPGCGSLPSLGSSFRTASEASDAAAVDPKLAQAPCYRPAPGEPPTKRQCLDEDNMSALMGQDVKNSTID